MIYTAGCIKWIVEALINYKWTERGREEHGQHSEELRQRKLKWQKENREGRD